MSLWNPVGSSDLQTANAARLDDLVSRFGADGKNFTHLVDVQHVWIYESYLT